MEDLNKEFDWTVSRIEMAGRSWSCLSLEIGSMTWWNVTSFFFLDFSHHLESPY